ncbi:MAG: spore coat protein [Firmicutes bacterium]|nr:spore coat protein [Bacillota bacterium]
MHNRRLAPHEMLDLHELIGMKNVCAAKSAAMMNMVTDPQLRQFLQQEMQTATQQAHQIQSLLSGGTTPGGGRY